MEGANQPGIGSGGDEYHHIGNDFDVPIDPDFERLMLEEDDRLGKLGSLHQPSFDPFNDGPNVGSVDSSTTVATGSEGSTTKTQERKRRKNEVSFDISSDDVLRFSALSRRDAASKLKVSESTLKRVCRKYGIHRWPPRGKNKEKERFPVAEPSAGDILPLDSPEESLLMECDSTINVAHDDRADHSWPSISHLENESLFTLEDSRQQFGRRREYAAKSLGGELDSTGDSLDQPLVDAFKDGPDVSSVDSDTIVATSSEDSTTKTQERKRKKKGISFDISYDDVLRLSALSRRDAASKLEGSASFELGCFSKLDDTMN
ncbi:hypothetical protein Vadar_028543 [Vaccinium darrowii]|uniref:Uncharacterized protein n=1 Tax=Vaccinium darrowii TaxID=229202 RepID=A0ACB7XKJ4_9ERIC|nr:hypothetical protein Vadar_028543 [Vaccinium darrowii]